MKTRWVCPGVNKSNPPSTPISSALETGKPPWMKAPKPVADWPLRIRCETSSCACNVRDAVRRTKTKRNVLNCLQVVMVDRYWICDKSNKFSLLKKDFDIFIAVYQ